MTKVLITGANGRLAEYIVKSLRDDYELVLFSRSPLPEDRTDLPWVQGDLNDFEACQRAVEGVEVIQHLGAVPWPSDNPAARERVSARGRELPPFDATMRTNIMGTYYLMRAAVEAGVKTVVMAGSNCAFGHCSRLSCTPYPVHYLPLDEKHPSDVQGSYDYSKWAGEELLASFTRAWGIRTYITRPAQIYPPDGLERLAKEIQPATTWSGAFWGYVPSEDLADLHRMIQEGADDLPAHDVYVANGLDTVALEPSLELVQRFRPDLLPLAGSLSGHQAFFSVAKAQAALGWAPKRTWRDYC
jgi:nucleoside-diphosphate-sugar epimerase